MCQYLIILKSYFLFFCTYPLLDIQTPFLDLLYFYLSFHWHLIVADFKWISIMFASFFNAVYFFNSFRNMHPKKTKLECMFFDQSNHNNSRKENLFYCLTEHLTWTRNIRKPKIHRVLMSIAEIWPGYFDHSSAVIEVPLQHGSSMKSFWA